jgi:hypothetical protein
MEIAKDRLYPSHLKLGYDIWLNIQVLQTHFGSSFALLFDNPVYNKYQSRFSIKRVKIRIVIFGSHFMPLVGSLVGAPVVGAPLIGRALLEEPLLLSTLGCEFGSNLSLIHVYVKA